MGSLNLFTAETQASSPVFLYIPLFLISYLSFSGSLLFFGVAESCIHGPGPTSLPILWTLNMPSSTIYPYGFNVTEGDEDGNTELHRAAERGDELAVIKLVRMGADINATNNLKETPLHKAATGGEEDCTNSNNTTSFKVIDFLIEQGANRTARDEGGNTFLHTVLKSGTGTSISFSQLHHLVGEYGHLFSLTNDYGVTALGYALQSVKVELATLTLLHDKGADFKFVDISQSTTLYRAVSGHQSVAVLSKLIEFGADYERLDDWGWSLLHWAARYGNPDALAFFSQKEGLDINGVGHKGTTPLHWAGGDLGPESKTLEVVRISLDNGADRTVRDNEGKTPYFEVRSWYDDFPDRDAILELLEPPFIPASRDAKKSDEYGNTELHSAAERGDEVAVRQIVQMGADPNAKNKFQESPLHKAASRAWDKCGESNGTSCLNVIGFLLDEGANSSARDEKGSIFLHTLLDTLTSVTPSQLQEIVERYGHQMNVIGWLERTPLQLLLTTVKIDLSMLQLLSDKGADFKAVDGNGWTVSMFAVWGHQSGQVLSKLVEFEGDFKRTDGDGRSLLHWAARYGNPDALAHLIQEGGQDINARDHSGSTPLHYVGSERSPHSKPLKVVRQLLGAGGDKTIKNTGGRTPNKKVKMGRDFPDKSKVLDLLC